jgi:Alginate lyase
MQNLLSFDTAAAAQRLPGAASAAASIAIIAIVSLLALTAGAIAQEQPTAALSHSLLILDWSELSRAKQQARGGDARIVTALKNLRANAERARLGPTYSVTHKTITAPSGSKQDYMSFAPYWWPNPNTASGLPYVHRDGEVNPERDHVSDRKGLDAMVRGVTALALGYFFTEETKYADRAAELLRAWFLNNETKMNPHLKYAQVVPGRTQERGYGIIETHHFPALLDAIAILSRSGAWTKADDKQVKLWFSDYLQWLLQSPQGRHEAFANNNHGSWYDVQIAAYALFMGRYEIGKSVLGDFGAKRIAAQIESDGRQPLELARTRAWNYALFNLEALFKAAAIAQRTGIDLWNFETNNRGIRKALDWLIPFALGEKKWPYKEIAAFEPHKLGPLLRIAALRYREPAYERMITKLPKITGGEAWQLLYPRIAETK